MNNGLPVNLPIPDLKLYSKSELFIFYYIIEWISATFFSNSSKCIFTYYFSILLELNFIEFISDFRVRICSSKYYFCMLWANKYSVYFFSLFISLSSFKWLICELRELTGRFSSKLGWNGSFRDSYLISNLLCFCYNSRWFIRRS